MKGGMIMENLCLFERLSKLGLGLFFLLISIVFMVSGFTVLPVFGLVIALAFFLISIYVFRVRLKKDCQIQGATE
jgi:hypothetical protein